ncbi:hypothetical protein RSAG8_04676, partial [Rhizoctonia solani AG-8 WAC10335]
MARSPTPKRQVLGHFRLLQTLYDPHHTLNPLQNVASNDSIHVVSVSRHMAARQVVDYLAAHACLQRPV